MNILVIGESGIDKFIYCDCNRLAPDIPVPVVIPKRTVTNPGLAANVVTNIQSLRPNWNVSFIHQDTPIIKTRYVDATSNHTFIRVDENDSVSEGESFLKSQIGYWNYDCIVISDYDKGFLSTDVLECLFATFDKTPTFIDTKKQLGDWSQFAFCGKINEKEYLTHKEPAEIHIQNLVETVGPKGANLYTNYDSASVKRFNTRSVDVRDLSGAGDSFLSALIIKYLETKDLNLSVVYANSVAAVAISKRGVFAVTQEEVDALN